jgi:hypothetical protein
MPSGYTAIEEYLHAMAAKLLAGAPQASASRR